MPSGSGDSSIIFRAITERDLATMKRWLEDPDVSPWYAEDSTELDDLREHYREEIAGTGTTRAFIIQHDGTDIGYIQSYRIDDEPAYARQLQVEQGAVGIDLYIGEQSHRNRGMGSRVLEAFLRQIVFGEMDAKLAIIAPDPKNVRAVRSYEKAGFVGEKTVWIEDESPANTGYEYVMKQTREAFESCGESREA